MTKSKAPTPPQPGAPGYGRDNELEQDRGTQRPAAADLDSTEAKAEQEPILGPGLDPDMSPETARPQGEMGEAGMTHQNRSDRQRESDVDAAFAVAAKRLVGKPDQLKPELDGTEDRQEALIDEGLEETFPASDPVAAKQIT